MIVAIFFLVFVLGYYLHWVSQGKYDWPTRGEQGWINVFIHVEEATRWRNLS